MRLGDAGLVKQGGQAGGMIAQPAVEAGGQAAQPHAGLLQLGQPAAGVAVVRVGCHERAHVGAQGAADDEQRVALLEIAIHHGLQLAGRGRLAAANVLGVHEVFEGFQLLAHIFDGGLEFGRAEAGVDVGEVPMGQRFLCRCNDGHGGSFDEVSAVILPPFRGGRRDWGNQRRCARSSQSRLVRVGCATLPPKMDPRGLRPRGSIFGAAMGRPASRVAMRDRGRPAL